MAKCYILKWYWLYDTTICEHPFQRMTRHNPNAVFMTLNKKAYRIPKSIQDRTIHLTEDIASLIINAQRQLTT